CLLVRLEPAPGLALTAGSTHLGLARRERARQASLLVGALAEVEGPLVLGGDMNDWFPGPDTRIVRDRLRDAWSRRRDGLRGATYPSALPLFRLDHVYVSGPVAVQTCRAVAIRGTSDHRPVVARIEVARAADAATLSA